MSSRGRARGAWRGAARPVPILVLAVALLAPGVVGQPVEVPGGDAVFAGRGVAILWGVIRGPDEARTRVVVWTERLDAAAPWRLLSVQAADPLTGEREWVRLGAALEVNAPATVELPREAFVSKPSLRFLFYTHPGAVQRGRPGLVVFFVSIPDTVPEFASRAELEDYFRRARARLTPR